MADQLPKFRNPPVVETALSVQFDLPDFRNAHLGLYWGQIRDRFPQTMDANPIEPQFERFGEHVGRRRMPELKIGPMKPLTRLQAVSDNEHEMVQAQGDRFVFNWRRVREDAEYPSWGIVRPRFDKEFHAFEAFLAAAGLAKPEQNQWEVTYVNHLHKGREWQELGEWGDVVPGLIGSAARTPARGLACLDTVGMSWHYVLTDEKGRLHVDIRHGFLAAGHEPVELLVLQLTARGEINASCDLPAGLEIGHRAIVTTFTAITSDSMHRLWGRVQ